MKLIVDSGSTKADWIAINQNGEVIFKTSTLGLNPEVLNKEEIITRLEKSSDLVNNIENVNELFFYGAGCGTDRMKNFLKTIFEEYFHKATVSVLEDTYGAVFASTLKNTKAIVCILGTGSNCSYFDGTTLHQKVQSLGYIVMDDCSGNRFGRSLIREYYFGKMPKHLATAFENSFDLDADVIKNNLYKIPNANAYLAKFAQFLVDHKNEPLFQKIIQNEIEGFIENYIKQFDNCFEIPINFIGSIAFYLEDELKIALQNNGMQLGTVIRKPIDGLITYHK